MTKAPSGAGGRRREASSDGRDPRPTVRALFVVVGGLVCQMGLGYNYVFGALAPDVLAEFGWTKAQFAGARAPQLWVMALASPLVGFGVVRFGARAVLVASTLVLGASFVLLSGMDALWQLYVLLCLQALAVTGLGDITVGQVVSRWFGRHRGLALGVVYTGSNLGGALVVRAAGGEIGIEGWRAVLFAMGLGAFVLMLPVAWLSVREPRGAERGAEEARLADSTDPESLALGEAIRTRSFWILLATLMVFFFYFVAVLDHLVLYLGEEGYERGAAQGHLANAILLGMASKVAFGWVADRVTPRTGALLDFALLAASSLLLLLPPSAAVIWTFVLLFGFSAAARDVVYPLLLADCFGVRFMAEIYGALMLSLPAGALGAWFAAAVSDRLGGYDVAFATFAVLDVAAVLGLLFVRNERGRSRRSVPVHST